MEPRHLMILRELADRGSLTAVAAALHLTPSAVSQQLRTLQRGVAVPLTRMQGRTLVLTDAGRALADAATDVAAALARAGAAVDAHLADPHGAVRVAAFHSAAATFFPRLLAACAQGGPAVQCADEDVAEARFPELTADYDVVIAHRPDRGPRWPRTVAVTPLLREPLDVALPTGHRLAARPELGAAELDGEVWIAVHEGFPLLPSMAAIAATADHPLTIRHRINDFTVAAAVVAGGGGVALLPRYTAPHRPDVITRPLRDVRIARRIDVLCRPEHTVRTAVTTVLAALARIAADLVARDDLGSPAAPA